MPKRMHFVRGIRNWSGFGLPISVVQNWWWVNCTISPVSLVMDIGYFSCFLDFFSLYLLSRETQCDTHLKSLLQIYLDSPRYYLLSNDSISWMIVLTWTQTFVFLTMPYSVIMIVAMLTYQSACGCVCQSAWESLTTCFFIVSY